MLLDEHNSLLLVKIKYSPVDFKLSCKDGNIIFQVKDRGIGIPAIDQKRLFEPFYRGSNINKKPGNGLGLSVIKTLVDLHGGQIAVESKVDAGTTFTIRLPFVKQTSANFE
ncbi:MAG: sensor histidine kinase [Desmonostoc vinosum HA7617-LM4]|jgi:signal transduction histidine kinase|nr:sensor histidine kinase [Desmonostoc vinosum HA7617-LM4]